MIFLLYISYRCPINNENFISNVQDYFNNVYEDEWFDDELVKQMVLDVDKSEVQSANCVFSPVLGTIPITKLSGGVKALILMYKRPDLIIWATACGDNCAKWIIELSKRMDIRIVLEHIMNFPYDFEAICTDNSCHTYTVRDYIINSLVCLE